MLAKTATKKKISLTMIVRIRIKEEIAEMPHAARIRMGVCGLGRSGLANHIETLRGHASQYYELVAVADIHQELAKSKAQEFNCRGYGGLAELFSDEKVELVAIATLSSDHAQHAIMAMEAGKDVIIDKPMATTYADAKRMIEVSERTGRRLTVFHNRRYDQDFRLIGRLREQGLLGRPFFIANAFVNYSRRNDWQLQSKYGGGLLNNWGPHLIDQLLLMAEKPVVCVYANLQQRINAGDTEDHFKVTITFEGDVAGETMVSNASLAPLPRWRILADDSALLSIDKTKLTLWRYVNNESQSTPCEAPADPINHCGHFYINYYTCAQGDRNLIDPRQAANVVRVMEAARKSHMEKRSIRLEEIN
jgi:predicted dehydrogenase